MKPGILDKYVEEFDRGHELTGADAEPFLDALISESDEKLLVKVFVVWDRKGIEENEIYSIAKIMRDRCTKVTSRHDAFIDIVGTGGSNAKTFNVSTAAAFVVAGADVPVAKHGNKAATSNSGSADVLSELGIHPAVDAATAERCLNEIGICFMFAPNFHRLSPTLGKVRRGLGFPTIFNCVGPLCNPAGVPHQLIGVWNKDLVPKMAGALARLGTKKSWIVHGTDGLDEISISGRSLVAEVENGAVTTFDVHPNEFGLLSETVDGTRANSAQESAAVIRSILSGKQNTGAACAIVQMNAIAGLYLTGRTKELRDGSRLAAESISSGRAQEKLERLAEATRQ